MSTYVVGDVQGCFDSLQALLDRVRFDPAMDTVWFAGDLVNRGPRSLEVLRFIRDLGARAVVVLGNHDLYLLRRANGWPARRRDSLDPVLDAPDRAAIIDWLRAQPLMHRKGRHAMIHAGLLPQWSLADASGWARAAEARLRSDDWGAFVESVFRQPAVHWEEAGAPTRLRLAVDAFTRLRMVDAHRAPDHAYKGPPGRAPAGLAPWYKRARALRGGDRVYFGHWAAHGLSVGRPAVCLDTGCVWGGHLTALRLEDRRVFQQPAVEPVATSSRSGRARDR